MADANKEVDLPYKLEQGSEEENLQIGADFKGYLSGVVRVQPSGYFFQGIYEKDAKALYNFPLMDSDVFVASYPKSGTTWMQELVWLLLHDLDYEKAKVELDIRFPFIEADSVIDFRVFEFPEIKAVMTGEPATDCNRLKEAIEMASPRPLKTHMPFSLLPPHLLDTCKVIYVARNPRDVVVSYYHHHRLIRSHGFQGDFKTFFEYFINERVLWSPFWSHIREAWELREHPNLLIVTFEQMKADLSAVISKVAKFLGKTVSKDKLPGLLAHLDVSAMKNNPAVNGDPDVKSGLMDPSEGGFIRKGKCGGWSEYFDEDMKEKFSHWIKENSRGLEKEFGWQ